VFSRPLEDLQFSRAMAQSRLAAVGPLDIKTLAHHSTFLNAYPEQT